VSAYAYDAVGCQFTGKERDSESALDNFGKRYNSSSIGRFMSADEPLMDQEKANPQSWNLYSYVRNNSLNNTDPTGNACVSSDGGKTFHDDDSGGQSCKDAAEADKKTNPQAVVTPDDEPVPWYLNWGCIVGCNNLKYLNKPIRDAARNMKPEDLALMAVTGVPFPEGELVSLGRPFWANTSGGFVNWLVNLQRSGTKLTKEQADAIIAEAKKLGVDVRLDPPHGPGNPWNVDHLNVGRNGQAHLEVPAGYDNPSVPKGSVRKP
jgi:RHS repeat-associated protein